MVAATKRQFKESCPIQMKILIVDDHVSFCEGLIAAIQVRRPEFRFSFESDAELVPASLLGCAQFDLLIIDIMMPGLGGVELVKHLNAMSNFVPILVMSSIEDVDIIQQLYSLGILGFAPKYYSVEEIINVIDRCKNGEMHIPKKLIGSIHLNRKSGNVEFGSSTASDENSIKEHSHIEIKLTKRQIEILSLMDRGLSNQEMAQVLHISLATVKTHIHHIYTIFGVNNRVNCLRTAKKARLR